MHTQVFLLIETFLLHLFLLIVQEYQHEIPSEGHTWHFIKINVIDQISSAIFRILHRYQRWSNWFQDSIAYEF